MTRNYTLPSFFLAAVLNISLTACSQSYVVLLPEEDGSLGKVQVTTQEGTTVLDKAREGTNIGGKQQETFEVSKEQINKDFGDAIASSPRKPISFSLYFIQGGAELTPESMADIANIYAEIERRPAPDISVTGHTDTVGDAQDNARLSLRRAETTAEMLKKNLSTPVINITIESHGETNLLVQTPDNVPEPRNRRVEVTVR